MFSKRRTTLLVLAALFLVLAAVGAVWQRAAEREEVRRLSDALLLRDGMTVAEIGAGTGWLTVEVARRVTASGKVYSTELSPTRRAAITQAVADSGLTNVAVVEAGERNANLAAGCCDAVFMRRVYHHLADAPAINADISMALKPGGALVIIDFELPRFIGFPGRWGLGTERNGLVDEMTRGGFQLVRIESWPGPFHYMALFRKPREQ